MRWNLQVETNRVSSFVFTVFVGVLGVPGMVTHCVFGCCLLVDLQQLLYANRLAMSNVSHRPHIGSRHTGVAVRRWPRVLDVTQPGGGGYNVAH